MGKDIVCIDFDGTVHSYASGWKGPDVVSDAPMPGAMDALRLYTKHFQVSIFSSRNNQEGGVAAMQEWLNRWASLEHGGGARWPDLVSYPIIKPPAKVILDDRAMQFTGEWPSVQTLKAFKPFYMIDRKRK